MMFVRQPRSYHNPGSHNKNAISDGFWIISENKLYVQQMFIILKHLIFKNEHLWMLEVNVGYKRTTPRSHDFKITSYNSFDLYLKTFNLFVVVYL